MIDEKLVLADGIELIGEMEGSGFKDPPSLVRRADGQVIQLTPLLYAVAAQADGTRTSGEIADAVGQAIGRGVSADNVETLVERKLRPLGVLAEADGSSPKTKKADPFLALNFRAALIPERLSNALAFTFQPMFFAPLVLAVLAAWIAADVWLFTQHGVAQAIRTGMYHPGMFLPLFGAVVLSAAFHEIGHAAGCRYSGGQPGKMGCGLYLAWPAFYTDVTDAYRLGRRGRLRTDLGGVYFNVIVIVATFGVYWLTGNEAVLLLVIVQHFEIVHQLLPVVRLDGYYIVADLTGVPDLFARIRPILSSLVPWRRADERVTVLKRWVRVAVTLWVVVVVPLLVFQLLMVLIHLPRILGTAVDSGTKQLDTIQDAFADGRAWGAVGGIVELVLLALPVLGILLMLANVGKRVVVGSWRRTDGRPVARAFAVVAMVGFVALLLFAWLPRSNYEPIRPGERGTLAEGIDAVRLLPTGHGPLESRRAAEAAGRLDPATSTDEDDDTPSSTTTVAPTTTTSPLAGSSGSTVTTAATSSATTARSLSSTTTAPRSSTTTSTSTSTSTSTTSTTAPDATTTTSP